MAEDSKTERDWKTRKLRIDPALDALGWVRPRSGSTPLGMTKEIASATRGS